MRRHWNPDLKTALIALLVACGACSEETAAIADAGVPDATDGPTDTTTEPDVVPDVEAGTEAEAPPACWAQILPIGGESWSPGAAPAAVATGPEGDIYVVGRFVDANELDGTEFPGELGYNMFIAKVDAAGKLSWHRSFPLKEGGGDFRISVRNDGAVAVAGEYRGILDLGEGPLGGFPGSDAGSLPPTRGFVGLFDASGNHLWSRGIGPSGVSRIVSLDVSPDGGVTVTGGTGSPVEIEEGVLIEGRFVVHFDDSGSLAWWWPHQPTADCVGGLAVVSTAADGSSALAGMTVSSNDAGSETDFFDLARLDTSGVGECSIHVPQEPVLERGGLHVYAAEHHDGTDPIVLGYYRTTLDLGGGPLPMGGGCGQNLLLARFDASGDHVWSRGFLGPEDCFEPSPLLKPVGLAIRPTGDILITGEFGNRLGYDEQVNFGDDPSDALEQKSHWYIDADGPRDIFLARFDRDGQHLWSRGYGVPAELGDHKGQTVRGIAADPEGGIVLVGDYWGGELDFGCVQLPPSGGGFIVRLGPEQFE